MSYWWKIGILSLIAGWGALLFSGGVESAGGRMPAEPTAAVSVIACPSGAVHALCEQEPHLSVPTPTSLSLSYQGKDFQKHADNPLSGNLKIEWQTRSYLVYTHTFPAVVSLSELQRLNI